MSITLMSLAWKSSLASGRKMVLLALCDWANDQGECYPSIPTLAMKCSMGERTVQGHIADLEELGIITRFMRSGTSTFYYIHSAAFPGTPAESAPPQNLRHTPANSAGLPPQNSHPTPAAAAPIYVTEPSSKPPRKSSPARGSRLPEDWTLPEEWKGWALSEYPGVFVPAEIDELADGFKDYWTTLEDARAKRTEWAGPWRNWIRNAARTSRRSSDRAPRQWWRDDASIIAKGKEYGIEPAPGELMPAFTARIRDLIESGKRKKPGSTQQQALSLAMPEQSTRSTKPEGLVLANLVRKDIPQRRRHEP